MNTAIHSCTEQKRLALLEQRRLELAAKAAGIAHLMYMPRSFQHPSGLLYRSEPNARTRIWNPLESDGDLFRLALAVPSVNLHEIIVSECKAGGDVARRVREAFVLAVTGPVHLDGPARPSASADDPAAHNVAAESGEPQRPASEETAHAPAATPGA
jgi:hypothetical protein